MLLCPGGVATYEGARQRGTIAAHLQHEVAVGGGEAHRIKTQALCARLRCMPVSSRPPSRGDSSTLAAGSWGSSRCITTDRPTSRRDARAVTSCSEVFSARCSC